MVLSKNKAKTLQKSVYKSAPNLSRVRETDTRNRTWINPDTTQLQMLEELKYIADNIGNKPEPKPVDLKDLLVIIGDDPRPDSNYNPIELKLGIMTELEHTNNAKIASKIAKDQLDEDPNYYSKLKKIE